MSSDLESNLHQNNIENSNPPGLYEFGEFRLDAGHLMLFRNGEEISLTPKQVETLLALIERPGEVLSKNELMTRLWGDLAVEEANLIQNIYILRKHLGNSPDGRPFIETLRRRGYRFNAGDLRKLSNARVGSMSAMHPDSNADQSPANNLSPDPTRRERPKNWQLTGIVALCFAFLALGIWVIVWWNQAGVSANENALSARFNNFRTRQLSTDGGIYHAVLSPNGKHVYYVRVLGKQQSIRVRNLETDAETELIGGIGANYGGLDISPDGNVLFFTREFSTQPGLELFRVPSSGGIPAKIADGVEGWTGISPDGSQISYVRCPYLANENCSLYVCDSENGENERLIVSKPAPIRITDSVFLSDGKSVIYAFGQSLTASNEFRLGRIDVDTRQDETFSSEAFFIIKSLARLAKSNTVLITASQGSSAKTRLWTLDEMNGNVALFEKLDENASNISIDQSGSTMTATIVVPDFRLETFDLERGSTGKFLGSAESAVFSPDGRIVFSSPMSGQMDIWSADPDGSNLRQLTSDPADERGLAVSRDGSKIYFSSNRSGNLHVWAVNRDGTSPIQLTREVGGYPFAVSVTDGSIFYKSHVDDVLRRVSADGSVDELALANFHWEVYDFSPDSGLVLYPEKNGTKPAISISDLGGSNIRTVPLDTDGGRIVAVQWSSDSQYAYFIYQRPNEGLGSIYKVANKGGKPVKVIDINIGSFVLGQGFSISDDGQHFAVSSGNWKHDLILIDFVQ